MSVFFLLQDRSFFLVIKTMDDLEVTATDYGDSNEGGTESIPYQNHDVGGRDRSPQDS